MELLVLAAFGSALLVAGLRFRKGGADRLRRQPYHGSLCRPPGAQSPSVCYRWPASAW